MEIDRWQELSWENLRWAVLRRDGFTCQYCGLKPELPRTTSYWNRFPLHVDHIIPMSREGAARDPRNLVTACEKCNLRKSAKLWWPPKAQCAYCGKSYKNPHHHLVDFDTTLTLGYPVYFCSKCMSEPPYSSFECDYVDDIDLELGQWDDLIEAAGL